jgi:predicted O-methyltransferase YrrM
MREKIVKILQLMSDANRLERARKWLEIRLNYLLFEHQPAPDGTIAFEEFLARLSRKNSALADLLQPGGEAEQAVHWVYGRFQERASQGRHLPFPTFYNADPSLALLSYALARHLRPRLVLETGVCYGITSALVLLALERNNCGALVSIDLPALADLAGSYIGLAVPEQLKGRWRLHLGSSRRCLPAILSETAQVDLLIADSATVYTVQRHEYETVSPKLLKDGAALFNNIGARFQTYLSSITSMQLYSIWQIEKPSDVTGLLLRS